MFNDSPGGKMKKSIKSKIIVLGSMYSIIIASFVIMFIEGCPK